ncbi:chromosome segregation protein SMC [Tepidibacter thalassicus]|uniref:Chromosome partition protein Smc n=1 Tax=Tepidibacter thalassicus DSM 15285 TaxID=1123350 RepID=A0A1M5Q0G6_9FIRM|nr:chromosome segregation protein SMC [Tepidibacter thalassicus]SHH07644.1 condensin subunit Smc [Tepidibacter thalassicus DSM 15285]
MYLKKLELKGFKSFPVKTDIVFENGITSIVGPNGSGKSNVLDAIRWVLGEQSIKSLRGDKLEDVIFVGSDTKKPMNYCEVILTIDNKDGILDIDYSEVAIKRRAYRSGESEFYINNKLCRLKDIKELFLDTGIGREGYSIIEQGKIDEILSNNSNNRRRVFDEACGISKYRYKKQEGEKNLKNTKENLDRINDIFYEIENQLKPLEIQKDKSLKYMRLKDELKVLEVNNYIREIEFLDLQLKELNNHSKILLDQLNESSEIKNKQEQEILNLEKDISFLEEKITDFNENIHKLKAEIDHKTADLNLLNEKIKNIENNKERKEKELIELELKREKNEQQLWVLLDENKKLNLNLKKLEEQSNFVQEKTSKYREDLKIKEEKVESLKNNIINLLDEKNEKNIRLSSFNTNLENIQNRQAELKKELKDINLRVADIQKELNKNLKLKNEYNEKLNKLVKNKNIEINNLNKLKRDIKEIEININNKNLKINEYSSKLNIYYEMEKQYEGFNKGVKQVLKNKNLKGIFGAVAEIIKVPKKYETAIEVALGAVVQNIITQDEVSAKLAIEYLKKNNLGRVTFLPLNIIKGKKINVNEVSKFKGFLGIASDIVECESKFQNIIENVLGRTILVENIDVAIKLGKIINHKYKIVTLEGDVFNAGGALTGGSIRTVNNLLSRKRVIREFEQNISDFNIDLEKLIREKSILENKLETKEKDIFNLDIEIKNQEKINLTIDSNINKLKEDIYNLNNIKLKLEREKNGLKENLDYTNKCIGSLKEEINKLEEEILKLEKEIKYITQQKENNKQKYEKDLEILNNTNLDFAKLSQVYKNNEKEIHRINEEIDNIKKELNQKKEEIKKHQMEREELGERLILIKVEKEELKERINDVEKKFKEYKKEKLIILNELKNKKEILKNTEEKYLDLKESLYKLDSKIDKLEVSQENYFNNLWENYEMTFHDALKLKVDNIDVDKKKIENIKLQIKKLGNVNLDSIEEYKEVKKRYDFYKEQKQDLEKSIQSIEKLIRDLEINMRTEFSVNFEKINKHFIVVYKKLFGGGHGELRIVDKSNILESDIEIIAQPPGKKLKNINLLSGGEKALTAISILFAILLTKPTPFCILDEIEAPLDDANIYRYGEFLKELSKNTQFIIITHRRGTMEVSDYIYGVTMQEKGVSKVVSLELKQAKKMTEENVG